MSQPARAFVAATLSWLCRPVTHGPRAIAPALVVLLAVIGCASQPPPPVVISYSSTPLPAEIAIAPTTPTPTRRRRPTRLPTATPSSVQSPSAPTVTAAQPIPAAATLAPTSAFVTSAPASVVPTPADPANPDTTLPTDTEAAVPSPTDSSTAPVDATATSTLPAVVTDTPTLSPSVAPSLSPSATRIASSGFPGEVSEDAGLFVTSSSHSSRYYYAKADTGWHRIHVDNRVWFLTADALLRVFPHRLLHGAPTPTP
ncbi:MAG TPA: hypothetical protein VNL16_14500 [Chloroflexota bacterium]|nr:hypothetical protein [Chloroflexota bacterium]